VGGIAVVVVGILLILRFAFPGAITFLATPFWSVGAAGSAAAGNTALYFSDKQKLANELASVRAQNDALANENLALSERAKALTALVGTTTESVHGVAANVLVRPPVSPYDTLIIDGGSADGIAVGATVRADGGVPVGTVSDVAPHSAHVLLYSTPGVETPGWIGDARVPVVLTGTSAGSMVASVPATDQIVEGSIVLVGGAHPVGTVVRVDRDPSSPTMTVRIRPLVSPFSLTTVLVLPRGE
jgi:cell shape-determining protein MreC